MAKGPMEEDSQIISTDEDSSDKIDLLDAEKVAADWEYRP